MSYFVDQYWSGSYWSSGYWALEAVVSGGYPALPIDNGSTRKPLNLGSVNLTASGSIRVRNFQDVDVFEFNVIHTLLTQSEAESIFTDWQSNRSSEFSLVWVDGNVYSVRYKEPPSISHMRGQWWKANSKLIGHAA